MGPEINERKSFFKMHEESKESAASITMITKNLYPFLIKTLSGYVCILALRAMKEENIHTALSKCSSGCFGAAVC